MRPLQAWAFVVGAFLSGAVLLAAQQPDRSQPPLVSDSAGGFVLRRLEAPVTPDGKNWLRAEHRSDIGTIQARDKSFAVTLGDRGEEGDVVRFRATFTPAGGRPCICSNGGQRSAETCPLTRPS